MRFEEQFKSALTALKADPQDRQASGEISSSFWSWLSGSLGEIIREGGDTEPFIEENAGLMNYGVHGSLVDAAAVLSSIADRDAEGSGIRVCTMTQWLRELLAKVKQGDKVEKLEHDIKMREIEHKHVMSEISDLQNERRVKIENLYFKPTDPAKSIAEVEQTEKMLLASVRKKREIAKGAYFSVDEKREHVKQQVELQKRQQFTESFLSTLPNKEGSAEAKRLTKLIEDLFNRVVDVEYAIKKLTTDLEIVQKKSSETTPGEIENRISEDLDYIRDLTRLSAKRIGLDAFPLVREGDKVFSLGTLVKNLSQITEFDPHLFRNDRVPIFGRPYVFLVPGTGNAIYDWKNNCIILPMIPPGGNYMASLATGIIEYRLDVDETKNLLTSYNQLPDLKTVRSIIQLKARLIKEYVIWMTSEYNGFRILSKESKVWFEHEIGPSRNDIYTPVDLQNYALSTQEFNKLFEETTARIKAAEESEGAIQQRPDDLWIAGILYFQQGKFAKAYALMGELVKIQPENKMAWYNYGFIAMKQMDRPAAKEAFSTYCKLDTQSWWSKTVRDHLRNLA